MEAKFGSVSDCSVQHNPYRPNPLLQIIVLLPLPLSRRVPLRGGLVLPARFGEEPSFTAVTPLHPDSHHLCALSPHGCCYYGIDPAPVHVAFRALGRCRNKAQRNAGPAMGRAGWAPKGQAALHECAKGPHVFPPLFFRW